MQRAKALSQVGNVKEKRSASAWDEILELCGLLAGVGYWLVEIFSMVLIFKVSLYGANWAIFSAEI